MSSASAWVFASGNQGPMRVTKINNGRTVLVALNGMTIIKIDTYTGAVRFPYAEPSIQLGNAYRRFFELIEVKRYGAEMRNGKMFITDTLKSAKEIISTGITILLPTRAVMNIIGFYGGYVYVSDWKADEKAKQEVE